MSYVFVGVGIEVTASIFFFSNSNRSNEMAQEFHRIPSKLAFVNLDLEVCYIRCATFKVCRNCAAWLKWYLKALLYMSIFSMYKITDLPMQSRRTCSIKRWKDAGALVSPKSNQIYWKSLTCVVKAAFSWLLSSTSIWWYPVRRSGVVNRLLPYNVL